MTWKENPYDLLQLKYWIHKLKNGTENSKREEQVKYKAEPLGQQLIDQQKQDWLKKTYSIIEKVATTNPEDDTQQNCVLKLKDNFKNSTIKNKLREDTNTKPTIQSQRPLEEILRIKEKDKQI